MEDSKSIPQLLKEIEECAINSSIFCELVSSNELVAICNLARVGVLHMLIRHFEGDNSKKTALEKELTDFLGVLGKVGKSASKVGDESPSGCSRFLLVCSLLLGGRFSKYIFPLGGAKNEATPDHA